MTTVTKQHRLSVARAWEGAEFLPSLVRDWVELGPVDGSYSVDAQRSLEQLQRLAQLVADAEGAPWRKVEKPDGTLAVDEGEAYQFAIQVSTKTAPSCTGSTSPTRSFGTAKRTRTGRAVSTVGTSTMSCGFAHCPSPRSPQMADLTLEELAVAELQADLLPEEYVPALTVKVATLGRLVAMARELIRLRGALEFLGHRGHHVICSHQVIPTGLLPRDVIVRATARGWEDPLAPPATPKVDPTTPKAGATGEGGEK